jgi:hypothetical protein
MMIMTATNYTRDVADTEMPVTDLGTTRHPGAPCPEVVGWDFRYAICARAGITPRDVGPADSELVVRVAVSRSMTVAAALRLAMGAIDAIARENNITHVRVIDVNDRVIFSRVGTYNQEG